MIATRTNAQHEHLLCPWYIIGAALGQPSPNWPEPCKSFSAGLNYLGEAPPGQCQRFLAEAGLPSENDVEVNMRRGIGNHVAK